MDLTKQRNMQTVSNDYNGEINNGSLFGQCERRTKLIKPFKWEANCKDGKIIEMAFITVPV